MSVWDTATYKLTNVQLVYESAYDLLVPIFGQYVTPYLAPKGQMHGLEHNSTWKEVANLCGWGDPDTRASEDGSFEWLAKYASVERWRVGTEALYFVIRCVRDGRFDMTAAHLYDTVAEVGNHFSRLAAPGSKLPPKVFAKEWSKEERSYNRKHQLFMDASEHFKHSRLAFRDPSEPASTWEQERYFGQGNRVLYGDVCGRLLLLKGASEFVNQGLVLTRAHLDLLVECCSRLGNTYRYIATEYHSHLGVAADMAALVDETISVAGKARGENARKVVRAFHKAKAYTQMLIFENEQEGANEEERKDYMADGLNDILGLDQFAMKAMSVPLRFRMDYLNVYKWMPPPDFDPTSAFEELRGWHSETRASGADPNASEAQRELWRRIQHERKLHLATAYRSLNHAWPPTLTMRGNNPSAEEIGAWEPASLLPYYQYGKDIVSQVKDKATVCRSAVEEFKGSRDLSDRSFLLWYLKNAGTVDTKEDIGANAKGALQEENFVRVAYKPEAHKPGSRLFFIAPPRRRILLGEMEGNLSRVAEHYPGSLQGKSSSAKAKLLARLMDPWAEPVGIPDQTVYTPYIITFDLTKFSPKSNGNVTRDYHRFWAKVYGKAEVEGLYCIGPESKIIHTTCGLNMEYQNRGADLEGFRGRMMTMFHCDMLGAAARLSRERGYTVGKAVLACFIDDGSVKIYAAGAGEVARANAQGFLTCMQEIYAAGGQENNPMKTVVSRVGGEMLATQYVNREIIPSGLKAAMRLAPDYENPAVSLPEEMSGLFAAAQGCVKDGGDWIQTYKRYVEACLYAIHRWERSALRRIAPAAMALKLMTPKSYSGFGLYPLHALVSTVAINLTAEGMGMLIIAGRQLPEYRISIRKIVSQQVVKREPLSILRDPERVRAVGPAMVENRLMMRVVDWMESNTGPYTRFMAHYRSLELREHAAGVAVAMLAGGTVNVPLIQRAWKATPLAYVESIVSKFKRAATIIGLLGFKAVGGVRKANRKDVNAVLDYFP